VYTYLTRGSEIGSPAPACRFAEHVNLLRDDLWWDELANVNSDQKRLLEKLAKKPRSKYKFS
jgi:hypothetical protein